jgi:hypothetical protein
MEVVAVPTSHVRVYVSAELTALDVRFTVPLVATGPTQLPAELVALHDVAEGAVQVNDQLVPIEPTLALALNVAG